jgi:hypothetical protein
MNDRIEELILAYLHRGSTPEQERELFEACKTDAATAAMLRQHLILSLKLRQLRDEAQVPLDVQNSLLRRINETVIEEDEPARVPVAVPARRGFGWAHLFGASMATAAAAIALFVALLPGTSDTPVQDTAAVTMRDTVLLTRTDTVIQVRTLRAPSNIARTETPAPVLQNQSTPDESGNPGLAQLEAPKPAPAPVSAEDITSLPAVPPALASNHTSEQSTFLEQYNNMLVSIERVRLTAEDRVRF